MSAAAGCEPTAAIPLREQEAEMTVPTETAVPREGDRVRLTYGDGSSVEGTWRCVLELDDGTLHTHTRGQVRREVVAVADPWWDANR